MRPRNQSYHFDTHALLCTSTKKRIPAADGVKTDGNPCAPRRLWMPRTDVCVCGRCARHDKYDTCSSLSISSTPHLPFESSQRQHCFAFRNRFSANDAARAPVCVWWRVCVYVCGRRRASGTMCGRSGGNCDGYGKFMTITTYIQLYLWFLAVWEMCLSDDKEQHFLFSISRSCSHCLFVSCVLLVG